MSPREICFGGPSCNLPVAFAIPKEFELWNIKYEYESIVKGEKWEKRKTPKKR